MNGSITYRAKGVDNDDKDRWYEGYHIALSDTTYCFKEDYERHPDNTKHYIVFDQMTDWGLPNRHLQALIRPETLCMRTEYVKNNKCVFVGDIIEDENTVGIVRFGKYRSPFEDMKTEHYGFYIEWQDHADLLRRDMGYWMNCKTKIIGNIFDNPELLKKGEE